MANGTWSADRAAKVVREIAAELVSDGYNDEAAIRLLEKVRSHGEAIGTEQEFGRILSHALSWGELEIAAATERVYRGPTCHLTRVRCDVHGQMHGAEAEQLRGGIEDLLECEDVNDWDGDDWIEKLQKLVDRVDARDSLAWLEAGDQTNQRALDQSFKLRPAEEVARDWLNAPVGDGTRSALISLIRRSRAEGAAAAETRIDVIGGAGALTKCGACPAHRRASRAGIYIASKSRHGARWRAIREAGAPIISTWIDEAGEGQTADWAALWDRCILEASTAEAVIAYVEPGELHKGSLVEVGAALHAGVPVLWVGPEYSTAPRHRGVTMVADLEEALERAKQIAARGGGSSMTAAPEITDAELEKVERMTRESRDGWSFRLGRLDVDADGNDIASISCDAPTHAQVLAMALDLRRRRAADCSHIAQRVPAALPLQERLGRLVYKTWCDASFSGFGGHAAAIPFDERQPSTRGVDCRIGQAVFAEAERSIGNSLQQTGRDLLRSEDHDDRVRGAAYVMAGREVLGGQRREPAEEQ